MEILRPIVQQERESSKSQVHLVLPRKVIVDTVKRNIDAALVTQEMVQAWQLLCADCQFEIEALSLPNIADIKDWSLRMKAELPRGSFSVPVDIVRENSSMIQAWVSGRLIVKRKVPVAKKSMGYRERLQSTDFEWQYRDTSYSLDGIPTAEEMVGKRLKQALRSGDVVWRGILEKEKAIQMGEMVQLRSGEGDWEVSMTVVAQQDGYIGDVVNLKNPKTNAVLMGQVTGRGEAELR
jgi:flagella basal body P-ring formation protein FlgA